MRQSGLAVAALAVLCLLACQSAPRGHVLTLFGNKGFQHLSARFGAHAAANGIDARILDDRILDSDRFYRDASLLGGADDDGGLGPDASFLAFYIGHGRPEGFDAYDGKKVRLEEVQLGDGRLRYWWMVSCRTMAHGRYPHAEPFLFDPADATSANVFRRWAGAYLHDTSKATTPVDPDLRLACGGSTRLAVPTFDTIRALWEDLVTGIAPSDAFVAGASRDDSVPRRARVPLCITRGGSRPESTPLWDETFVDAPNPGGEHGSVFIQYPVSLPVGAEDGLEGLLRGVLGAGAVSPVETSAADDPPPRAPILELAPQPVPAAVADGFLSEGHEEQLGFRRLPASRFFALFTGLPGEPSTPVAGFTSARFQPCSGKLLLRGQPAMPRELDGLPAPSEIRLPRVGPEVSAALGVLRLIGGVGGTVDRRRPAGLDISDHYVDRAPPQVVAGCGSRSDVVRFHKSRAGEIRWGVQIGGIRYPVLGEGGRMRIEVGGDGSLVTASLAARRIAGLGEERDLLDLEKASRRAIAEAEALGMGPVTEAPRPAWGYLEAPASCFQREMGIVYRFTFEPAEDDDALALVIDVPAFKVEPPVCYGDPEWRTAGDLPRGCSPGSR